MHFNRLFLAGFLLILNISVVSAYTLVMRDGRRVEIPNDFKATNSTLTYDVSSGIQITIQLNTVDIAATERANGESAGSLLRRATAPQSRNEQSRMRISRNIVTRVSKVRPNARSWACLHWKSDSVRLQKLPIELSSRSAACGRRRRPTGSVGPMHSALRRRPTARRWSHRVKLRMKYRGPIRLAGSQRLGHSR